jgi:phosphoinositide-3-kinase, regulatory subunit 4
VSVLRLDNALVFPEYLLRAFQHFITSSEKREKPSAWVRATYASCLGTLASTASHFLDIVQTEPSNDPTISDSQYQNLYDVARQDLIEQFETHTKALLTDTDPSVRRALLPSVSTLCVFFGKVKASYVILGYLNTYINDKDWMLKCAFFEAIVGVATYMGTAVLEEFILPLMIQALTDPEESVVERVIRCFSSIAELGIFQPSTVWELIDTVARFTMHPNVNIREAATQFIAASATYASIADQVCIITPLIREYLRVQPVELSEDYLLDILKKPLPRVIMDLAGMWAVKIDKSLFWKGVQHQRVFSFGFGENTTLPPRKSPAVKSLARIPRTEEDENWIDKLRKADMKPEDEIKLIALQEYIWKTAHRKAQEESQKQEDLFLDIVKLNQAGLKLETIIFENQKTADHLLSYDAEQPSESRTIADALHDATTTEAAPNVQKAATDPSSKPTDIPASKRAGNGADTPQGVTKRHTHTQEPSSFDSKRSLKAPDQQIQKKGSAMNLMGLRDSSGKAAAADTSTDTTNAFGKVERSYSREGDIKPKESPLGPAKRIKPVHTYSGHDPNVLRLLDSLYMDNYPIELIEFGQVVPPSRGEPIRRGGTNPHRGLWQPEGILIAMLGEHKAGINRVVVAPDQKFFITGSDDGTVKVWDTGRLERTVHHRPRNTHVQGVNVQVTSLAFVENTHCFISTGSDGSVHLVKVDCSEKSATPGGPLQYGKLHVIREYQLPDKEFAVWCEHQKLESQSLIVIATNKSNIYGVELRTMEVIYELKNPLNHGTPTCFCVDRRGHWLLVGTSHGVLDLWDLRFKVRVRSWGFPHGSPIYRILPPMLRGSKRVRVTIAGGAPGTIIALDIEKSLIREVYKASIPNLGSDSAQSTPKKNQPLIPTLVDLEHTEHQPGGFLGRFKSSSSMETNSSGQPDLAVRALAMGAHVHDSNADPRYAFLLAAGPDWKIRFWDSKNADACGVVSGLDVDESPPTYAMQNTGEAVVISEKDVPAQAAGGSGGSAAALSMEGGGGGGPSKSPAGKKGKIAKGSIVSLQQQSLLRGHKDTITDIAVLEVPYGMVVSVDRAGMIYVWS